MPLRRDEKLNAERFGRRLEKKLGGCVTLPFGRELWEYRSLVEIKKTRRLNRVLTAVARFTRRRAAFPYPTRPELFMKDINDSDSSYGRDESVLSEGYYISRRIYSGSPGVKIYLCEPSIFSRNRNDIRVAVKVINIKKTLDNYLSDYVAKELDVILQVQHPFIIETLCVLFKNKQYFIFMRHAERGDLFAHLVNYGAVTERRARVWAAQLGSALSFLHSLEIAHTDLCCENILLTANFNMKITDFECAVRIKYAMGKALPIEDFRGSAEYATPEILQGRPYLATGADTWALGVVLYAMLTANLPFPGQTNEELLKSQRNWKFKDANIFSSDLGTLFHKLFQYKSTRRYNLHRFLQAEWFRKDMRLTRDWDVAHKKRPWKEDFRPGDDPGRQRLVIDPAQEQADGEDVRFQPFLKQKVSNTCLIPVVCGGEELAATSSDDQSFGVPFKPGEEQARQLLGLEKLWESNKTSKKKSKPNSKTINKKKKMAKLLYKAYNTAKTQESNE